MPELPEVETVRRGLLPALEDHTLIRVEQRRPDLRWPLPDGFAERLTGRRITALRRRAKYLLAVLDDGMVLVLHLGMSGRILVSDARPDTLDRHDHIVFTTDSGTVIRFNDARRFGMADLWPQDDLDNHPQLAGLGPEPLGNAFNGPCLVRAIAGRNTPIKSALLDQRVVAGLGNIYVCEALHVSGVSPLRRAASISVKRCDRLVSAIRDVLIAAIDSGGSTLRDHVRPSGELGYFQHHFQVYDHEGALCPKPGCQGRVRRIVQSGRSTFYCARCQR